MHALTAMPLHVPPPKTRFTPRESRLNSNPARIKLRPKLSPGFADLGKDAIISSVIGVPSKAVVKSAKPIKKNDSSAGMELRRYPRLKPSAIPFIKSISFNQGLDAQVIDISRGGMLIETDVRLRPQMKMYIKLVTTDGVIKLDGSILRSFIVSLKGVPRYQSAIVFDFPFHMLDDMAEDPAEEAKNAQPESASPAALDQKADQSPLQSKAVVSEEDSAFLTLFTDDTLEASLDVLKLNDW
jgi:hypothetical protein